MRVATLMVMGVMRVGAQTDCTDVFNPATMTQEEQLRFSTCSLNQILAASFTVCEDDTPETTPTKALELLNSGKLQGCFPENTCSAVLRAGNSHAQCGAAYLTTLNEMHEIRIHCSEVAANCEWTATTCEAFFDIMMAQDEYSQPEIDSFNEGKPCDIRLPPTEAPTPDGAGALLTLGDQMVAFGISAMGEL